MPGSLKKVMLFLSPFVFFLLLAQHTKAQNKIDLPFQILIANQKIADSISQSQKKASLKKSRRRKPLPVDTAAKKYECVIHTTNPAALRKMGIVVQSELPAFVTALATLKQIELAATLPEVTFIAAPDKLDMHNK